MGKLAKLQGDAVFFVQKPRERRIAEPSHYSRQPDKSLMQVLRLICRKIRAIHLQ